MPRTPVIAIYDIGKTNKKVFLFDESYRIIWEDTTQLEEIKDEDGFPSEDLQALQSWMKKSFVKGLALDDAEIRAINFSGYGASFVHLNQQNEAASPLYNYLKPYPHSIEQEFYKKYGGAESFAQITASPLLGSLNSGLQLLRFQIEKPAQFQRILYSLHLPQWLSHLFTQQFVSDMTSIGCHTAMWNFQENRYHEWLEKEGVSKILAPIVPSQKTFAGEFNEKKIMAGIGLHDSSAALIPYLLQVNEPFVLISTGTWSISLNPFNQSDLSSEELSNDCLCYIDFKGNKVKASRLFAGQEHEQMIIKLAEHFQVSKKYFQQIRFDAALCKDLANLADFTGIIAENSFSPDIFHSPEEAYHRLMIDLAILQRNSTRLILRNTGVKKIFVDGGFRRNEIFMNLLPRLFPDQEIYAATVAQASALGAAMAIHSSWNGRPFAENLISLQSYSAGTAFC
jgi:sugar (pentulose or hexulose) kinase